MTPGAPCDAVRRMGQARIHTVVYLCCQRARRLGAHSIIWPNRQVRWARFRRAGGRHLLSRH
jgi:hypothetical protein